MPWTSYISSLQLRCILLGWFVASFITIQPIHAQPGITTQPAQAESNCKDEINDANGNYELGRADDVINLLQPCINGKKVEKDDRVEMYRLLALSYLAKRDSAKAFQYVQDLIHINKRFKSRLTTDDPQFKLWINQLRPKWHKRWIWRGIIVSTVTGATLGYRALISEKDPLPLPPAGPR